MNISVLTEGAPSPSSDAVVMKRCFVGFFGLNRSLKWTLPSIETNVLGALRKSGYEVCLAGHFNCPDSIVNIRSGENGVPLDMSSVHRLGLHLQWLERQQEASIEMLLPQVLSVPYYGYRDADGQTRKNALFQLHSLRRLRELLRLLDQGQFRFYGFFRPDLEYLDAIPVVQIEVEIASGRDLLTPSWHRWGGLNDRFAICSRRGMEVYLSRVEKVLEFCAEKSYFHSEQFLAYTARGAGLSIGFLGTRARRIRATGDVWPDGFSTSEA